MSAPTVIVPFTAPSFETERAEITIAPYPNGVLGLLFTDLDAEEFEQEVLTVNLTGHGLVPPPGHVHVPDYTPHSGVAAALEKAGLATIISPVTFGFGTGFLVRLEGPLAPAGI